MIESYSHGCPNPEHREMAERQHPKANHLDCHDGKPVVEFQVPCPGSRTACPPFSRAMCRFGGEPHPAGRWTVTEALPIVERPSGPHPTDGAIVYLFGACWWLWRSAADYTPIRIDGDLADLIGKYLVIVEGIS